MTGYENDSVPLTLDRMKMLFWRLDLIKRTFVNLNDCPIGVLGLENYRFFKDSDYRDALLFPDDREPVDRAVAGFKDRVPVKLVFRVQKDNTLYWFKMTGWPTADHRYYEGAVEDITDHVAWLKRLFEQQDQHLLNLADQDYPVAVFALRKNRLVNANRAFQDLVGIDLSVGRKIVLEDLVKSEIKLPRLLEQVLYDRRLEIDLLLGISHYSKVNCLFEYFSHAGESFIRLAVVADHQAVPQPDQPPARLSRKRAVDKLCAQLKSCWSIDAMLTEIHRHRELFPGMDVVMFSDIHARQNKVIVYACGDMREDLPPGSQFPYTGTIAENIHKENLEYLIVDDTQSSIKAIDWVLFVPKGISSYIAKALYVRGAMRTVLIFCSRRKQVFHEHHADDVTSIATAFHQQLKQIRKKNRQQV